jgi:hypothetical protein
MRAPSRIDRNTHCTDISQMNMLLRRCSLVNSNGTLTPARDTAMSCNNYVGQRIRCVLSIGLYAILRNNVRNRHGLLAHLTDVVKW